MFFLRTLQQSTELNFFFDKIVPYLKSRDIEVVGFMNAGFWRTDAVEERKSLDKAFKKSDISLVKTDKDWTSVVSYIDLENL